MTIPVVEECVDFCCGCECNASGCGLFICRRGVGVRGPAVPEAILYLGDIGDDCSITCVSF